MSAWDVGGPVWGLEAGPGSKTSPAPPIPIPAGLPGCGSLSPRSCEPPPHPTQKRSTHAQSLQQLGDTQTRALGFPSLPSAQQLSNTCVRLCACAPALPRRTRPRGHAITGAKRQPLLPANQMVVMRTSSWGRHGKGDRQGHAGPPH